MRGGASDDGMYRTAHAVRYMPLWDTLRHMPSQRESRHYNTKARFVGEPGRSTLQTWSSHADWAVETDWLPIDGRLEPVEVRVRSHDPALEGREFSSPETPGSVTADAIRKLPIGQMLAEGRQALRHLREVWAKQEDELGIALPWPDDLLGPAVNVGKPKRGQQLTHVDLEKVAEVYTAAWAAGMPVNEAVRSAFHLSKDGAAKRIAKARSAGLLDGIGPRR